MLTFILGASLVMRRVCWIESISVGAPFLICATIICSVDIGSLYGGGGAFDVKKELVAVVTAVSVVICMIVMQIFINLSRG